MSTKKKVNEITTNMLLLSRRQCYIYKIPTNLNDYNDTNMVGNK